MRIIVDNQEEKLVVETLIKQLEYTWNVNGEYGYDKAFDYVNDRTECWNNNQLIRDYKPLLKTILNNIGKTQIEVHKEINN